MRPSRIGFIDIGKCVAIWLVLWGHAMTQLMPSHDLDTNPAFVWLYSFHMPLFMLMSGLFARKALQLPLLEMVWKKFKQLIVPSVLFGLLWLMVDKPGELFEKEVLGLSLHIAKHLVTCYWFLKCLFLCFVIGWCIEHSPSKPLATVVFWGSFLLLQHWNITCFKMGSMLPFFLLGIWLKPHLEVLKNRALELLFASAAVHALLILSGVYTQRLAFPTYFFAEPDWATGFCHYSIYLLSAACGCVQILCLSMLVEERWGASRLVEGMRYAGTLTLWIYLWQKILLEILLPKVLTVEMSLWCFDLIFTPLVASLVLVSICGGYRLYYSKR